MAAKRIGHARFEPGSRRCSSPGRLAPQKDFPTLIRALRPGARAARGPSVDPRRRTGARASPVAGRRARPRRGRRLPGWVTNPYPYMVRSAAFVLSSRWEGLPSVLIEALYCGVPVIATDCPSGPVEILEGASTGCSCRSATGRARPRHGGGHRRPDPSPHRGELATLRPGRRRRPVPGRPHGVRAMTLPTFLGIGVPRAGTTWLHTPSPATPTCLADAPQGDQVLRPLPRPRHGLVRGVLRRRGGPSGDR